MLKSLSIVILSIVIILLGLIILDYYFPLNHNTKESKEKFRQICFKNKNKFDKELKNVKIPKQSEYEAIFIEFRKLPHVEFVIKNAIVKLGNLFSHTIVCGKDNYEFMLNIISKISHNIRIIKINVENMNVSDYNNLLLTYSFWEMFEGDKLLIYQEDSMIFKKNIQDFLEYDYIGAPLLYNFKFINGNGGLSLRNKKMILNILKKEKFVNKKIPEDLFFSKKGKEMGYNIAPVKVCSQFSVENWRKKNTFGGHQFWNRDRNWEKKMLKIYK